MNAIVLPPQPVIAEFRRTIFSEHRDVRPFDPGATLSEIAAAFPRPVEFERFGAIFLKRDADDPGMEVDRANWHRVRPKPGTCLFISCVPQEGEGGKAIFGIVAAIALLAVTAWVGAGGLAFLSPHLAAGTTGAKIAQAAITVAGAAAISALTKPPVGKEAGGGSDNLGYAGISQNVLAVNQQLPAVLGAMRISPPQIMRPFTEIDGTDQYVTGVVGMCGPIDINAIKVNETAIEDLPDGTFEYEVREGYPDDEQLELVRFCGFEETINLEMSKHRLDKDNATLIAPHTGSYPQPHILRTARRPDSFRVTLGFAQGLSKFDNGTPVLLPLRLEMRALGDGTWKKLPELHLEAVVRSPFRQEIVFHFGGDEVELRGQSAGVSTLWKRLYARNAEWQADAYFRGSANSLDFNTRHVYAAGDRVLIYCDPATFNAEKYDIRIVRGFVQSAGAQHSDTVYTGGLFTYRTGTAGVYTIPLQSDFAGAVTIESYTTFRNEYPFHQPGVAMLAFRAKNLRINSINFDATPIIPAWDGVDWSTEEPSSNPAALARWVRCGPLNARPVDPALAQGLEEWFEFCEDEGLSCNALISEGSVERAANLAANCGDALLRESDRWGPVIDRDRSAEPAKHGFSAHNMTAPLVMKKSFTRIADGIYPTFVDAQRDYATRTLDHGVFADGADVSAGALMEGATYDGLVFEALVVRRARLDLRRSRHRAVQYSWGCHQEQLIAVNGELTALAHDILSETYAIGRVKSFTAEGGLKTVTLNTRIEDIPVSSENGFFSVKDVFQLSDIFTLAGPKLGMQIRLEDASVVTIPVASVSDSTLTVEGTFPFPALLRRTALVHVGWRERVSRRVIITNIVPRGDYHAQIEAVDEAPQIFAGL